MKPEEKFEELEDFEFEGESEEVDEDIEAIKTYMKEDAEEKLEWINLSKVYSPNSRIITIGKTGSGKTVLTFNYIEGLNRATNLDRSGKLAKSKTVNTFIVRDLQAIECRALIPRNPNLIYWVPNGVEFKCKFLPKDKCKNFDPNKIRKLIEDIIPQHINVICYDPFVPIEVAMDFWLDFFKQLMEVRQLQNSTEREQNIWRLVIDEINSLAPSMGKHHIDITKQLARYLGDLCRTIRKFNISLYGTAHRLEQVNPDVHTQMDYFFIKQVDRYGARLALEKIATLESWKMDTYSRVISRFSPNSGLTFIVDKNKFYRSRVKTDNYPGFDDKPDYVVEINDLNALMRSTNAILIHIANELYDWLKEKKRIPKYMSLDPMSPSGVVVLQDHLLQNYSIYTPRQHGKIIKLVQGIWLRKKGTNKYIKKKHEIFETKMKVRLAIVMKILLDDGFKQDELAQYLCTTQQTVSRLLLEGLGLIGSKEFLEEFPEFKQYKKIQRAKLEQEKTLSQAY